MDRTINDQNLRNRGGSPEPVGLRSERVGSTRPSASDYPAPPVGSQAGVLLDATGQNMELEAVMNPFLRRDSIPRSPPNTAHMSDDTDVYETPVGENVSLLEENPIFGRRALFQMNNATSKPLDQIDTPVGSYEDEDLLSSSIFRLTENNEEDSARIENSNERSKKRKNRDETPVKEQCKRDRGRTTESSEEKELAAALKALDRLNKKTEELKSQVKISTKTKVEIKSITRELSDIVGNLNRKMDILKVNYLLLSDKARQQEKPTVQMLESTPLKELRSIGIQAEEKEIMNEVLNQKKEILKDVERELEYKNGWEGLAKIIDTNWPEKLFASTEFKGLEMLKEQTGDIAVIVDPDAGFTGTVADDIRLNFPDAEQLMTDHLEEGHIEFMKTNTETILSRGRKAEKSRVLYVLPYKMNNEGIHDIQKLYQVIGKLDDESTIHQTKHIKMACIGNIDSGLIRKCTEHIFRGTDKRFDILVKASSRERHKSLSNREMRQTEKIVIKSEGKNYADVLRAIKSNVNIEETGIKVKTIKKTMKGDVLLEIQGDKNNAEVLKQKIQEKHAQAKITIKNSDDILHVTGIDGDIGVDEIVESIIESVGNAKREDVKVLSVRPNQRGSQNATIAVKKVIAQELARKGTIRIGWTPCKIRPRVNLLRCYKCLEFGHPTRDCEGTDRTKMCLKCGKEGHRAHNCENISFCFTCKQEGHRADHTKCPHYRKLIRDKIGSLTAGNRGRLPSTTAAQLNDY